MTRARPARRHTCAYNLRDLERGRRASRCHPPPHGDPDRPLLSSAWNRTGTSRAIRHPADPSEEDGLSKLWRYREAIFNRTAVRDALPMLEIVSTPGYIGLQSGYMKSQTGDIRPWCYLIISSYNDYHLMSTVLPEQQQQQQLHQTVQRLPS